MELLTPDEVLNKKFQVTKFREGYDMVEVDDFLDLVLGTLRAVYLENDELKEKLAAAESRVAELSRAAADAPAEAPAAEEVAAPAPEVVAEPEPEVAPTPGSTQREPEMATGIIQMAQKLHDDHVRAGQEEGERLVAEARGEGDRIVREAQDLSQRTLTQLEQERTVLESKIEELRTFERDYRLRLKSYLQNLLGDLDQRSTGLGSDDSGI